jgi:hypothetical protein
VKRLPHPPSWNPNSQYHARIGTCPVAELKTPFFWDDVLHGISQDCRTSRSSFWTNQLRSFEMSVTAHQVTRRHTQKKGFLDIYRVYSSLPLLYVMSQMNPVHPFPLHFQIYFNIILPSTRGSSKCFFPSDFPTKASHPTL